jgi:periplasmic divalent cation tolerance protein
LAKSPDAIGAFCFRPAWIIHDFHFWNRLDYASSLMTTNDVLLVLTTLPDRAGADMLAARLVGEHLAACVNVLAPCDSVYRWQGAVETATEIPLLIKTTRARYPALEAAIRALHPYDIPELLALPIACGLPAYLDWVATSVTMPDPSVPDVS